ncbi:Integrase core domain [Serratia rubidaea]|uniref:Integrase core domain n=1 Tax=Serratia rubidaea TaxID=61652 RepID=A0A3S4FR32_SERRU|nr:Integrase core domain [Serratia rubidaea]
MLLKNASLEWIFLSCLRSPLGKGQYRRQYGLQENAIRSGSPVTLTVSYVFGFKTLFQVLRREGNAWNHKRVHRIYCVLKLNFRRKGKQRIPVRNPAPLATSAALNQSWSIDFMHDALTCGQRFRTFNIVDDFNREALAIEIDLNIPAQRVVRGLNRIVANRGYPLKMRMDNGPELISLTPEY